MIFSAGAARLSVITFAIEHTETSNQRVLLLSRYHAQKITAKNMVPSFSKRDSSFESKMFGQTALLACQQAPLIELLLT